MNASSFAEFCYKWYLICPSKGFPAGSVINNLPAMQKVQEKEIRSLSHKDPLEEEMANHSSILAWKNPRTEEPCRLQFMGSQRVGHD